MKAVAFNAHFTEQMLKPGIMHWQQNSPLLINIYSIASLWDIHSEIFNAWNSWQENCFNIGFYILNSNYCSLCMKIYINLRFAQYNYIIRKLWNICLLNTFYSIHLQRIKNVSSYFLFKSILNFWWFQNSWLPCKSVKS